MFCFIFKKENCKGVSHSVLVALPLQLWASYCSALFCEEVISMMLESRLNVGGN
jgi:hypothetical protein